MRKLRLFAKELRRNLTDAEKVLWKYLRHRQLNGFRFRRQTPIGPFIADFVSFEKRLIIELDGGGHSQKVVQDGIRDDWFRENGFHVLRFWNVQIFFEIKSVLEEIWRFCHDSPHPNPPPQGGREKK